MAELGMTGGRGWGPTKLYSLYDSPKCDVAGINQLRAAHRVLLDAVLRAYGWTSRADRMAAAPGEGWTCDTPWIDGRDRYVPTRAFRVEMIEGLIELDEQRYWEEIALYLPHVEAALGVAMTEDALLAELSHEGIRISETDLRAALTQGQREARFAGAGSTRSRRQR